MSSVVDRSPGGQRLGDFEVVRELGRGGMGVVYEARQVSLNRPVALKVLGPGLGLTPHAVQRFRREAEAAAKLHHTNIVPVYATGEQDGTHFYAMELIDGPSLDRVIRHVRESRGRPDGPCPGTQTVAYGDAEAAVEAAGLSASSLSSGTAYFDTVARLLAGVADALGHAHRQGILHRDIKPANLLLSPDGRLNLNDFGLARMLEEPGMTVTGEFLGTPAYMSPEQITGGRVPLDHRTDVYSLGATLYELLTLRPPFSGASRDQVLAQILRKDPPPPRTLNAKVPVDLETICLKALEKDPDHRYRTADALADDLRRYLNRFAIAAKRAGPVARLAKFVRRHKLATAAGGAILLLATVAGITTWLYQRSRQDVAEQAAATQAEREQADLARRQHEALAKVRDVERLIQARKFPEALALLESAVAPDLADDARLEELRRGCSRLVSVVTDPPGVEVYCKPANAPEAAWNHLGPTPLDRVRLARGIHRWKFEKAGYEPEETIAYGFSTADQQGVQRARTVPLDVRGSRPADMVRVARAGGRVPALYGLRTDGVAVGSFFLDRYEVTNRQFQQFVNQGGYQRKEFWEHDFVRDGKALAWDEAMALFRDATGRPGPVTWEHGSYPDGREDYPVSGVSWYEAAAYARFAGKSLPTIFHWLGASGIDSDANIVPQSNFGGAGPAKVGQYQGVGPFGSYDMAGNVKEWCFNGDGGGRRYALGGAWDEKEYMFTTSDALPPIDRPRNCGFRCVQYLPGQGPSADALREEKPTRRDYRGEKPLPDAEFEHVRRAYEYTRHRDLNIRKVRVDEPRHWVHERVEYDAAYGKERAVAYLFLPRHVTPPYQPVIYWPGDYALYRDAMRPLDGEAVAFLVRSGRALVWPVYMGTYERRGEPPTGAAEAWELLKQQVNDLRRAIDYLETRDDVRADKVGYFGYSWGASEAVPALAIEPRLKAAVLADGGLAPGHFPRPELDPLHYLRRVRLPVLMLNGEYDFCYPLEASQEPMFDLLGTPKADKKHHLAKHSHASVIQPEQVQLAVNWFDRYLGPVNRAGGTAGPPN
jgi:dienelactone hydrolase